MLIWKGHIRIIKSNTQPCPGHPKSHIMCLRALSEHLTSDAVTTYLGSPTTLKMKILFLIFNLSCPWHSFMPFSCVLPLVTTKKRSVSAPPLTRMLQTARSSSLSLFFLQAKQTK